jgi:putative transposase
MGRISRIVIPGLPHHVTQRGNRRADVFQGEDDRNVYLSMLNKYATEYGVEIWTYCLMTNHVHLVLVPGGPQALSQTMRDTHTAYALRFNLQNRLSGHLWQGRFFSCVLDDSYLWAAVRYVEQNPVRAGVVAWAEAYRWSSAAAHCGLRADPVLSMGFPPAGAVANWGEWLAGEEAVSSDVIRRQTHTGRPCGSAAFVTGLEQVMNRALHPGKRGRKARHHTLRSLVLFNSQSNS